MDATQQTAVLPATLVRSEDWAVRYSEKANRGNSNLSLLTYGTLAVNAGASSDAFAHPGQECLLFCTVGEAIVSMEGREYTLAHFDVLYVPTGSAYAVRCAGASACELAVCRAPAAKAHPPHHARWKDVSRDEGRIRHLAGKDVFLMFDVAESAETLLAGYTIYEPHTRAWPPHNHTDQEEIYIFPAGRGAMEVYADEETKTFVTSVGPGDAVTIPLLNYHPVFSQDEELTFIWCIAGERYWVGDRHRSFMRGEGSSLTT
jgi:mannose-6-phosphate isomerase-like protein (cupin superfamily)